MLDLESELRNLLHERSDVVVPATDLDAHIVRRIRARARTRRLTTAFVGVALIAGATVWATSAIGRDGTSTVRVVPGPATAPVDHAPLEVKQGQWATITEPPMTGAFASVWTGTDLVVAFRTTIVRFAAYDPQRDAWSPIPDPPVEIQEPFTDSSILVWTGHTVLVWGYENHGIGTFSGKHRLLAYDPETKAWQRRADPPLGPLIQAHPIWTGHELVVWGGNFNGEDAPAQGAAYDPGTNKWRGITDAPLSTRENPMIVWTGHEVIVWGGLSNGKATAADRLEGAAYDPATDSWRALPPSGSRPVSLAAAAWTGHEMIVSGIAQGGPPVASVGVAYNPTTNAWRDIASTPLSPREQTAWAWTGHELVVWGGITFTSGRQTLADGAAYDPTTDQWRLLATAPLSSRFMATLAWTGDLLVVLGGNGPSAPGVSLEPLSTGAAAYRP